MHLNAIQVLLVNLLLVGIATNYHVEASIFGKSVELVDEYPNLVQGQRQLTELAELVCSHKKNNKIIGRVSTIQKLADYFATSSPDALAECKSKFGASISSLKNVVSISNDNICSDMKISAIEDFHKRFVSKLSEDVEMRQTGEGNIPRMLLNFFAHYAGQVSRMCKESVVASLEKDVKNRFPSESDYAFDGMGTQFTGKLMTTMGNIFNSVHHYDDILIVWQLAGKEKLNSEKSLMVDTTNEATGEPVKLLIVAKDIKPLLMAQEKCRKRFRPVYSKVILPVSRLADIGYSFMDEKMKADEELLLKNNKLVELWYRLTQFCETILPIQFLQDANLDDKASAVITLDERQKYLEATAQVISQMPQTELLEYEPMQGLNSLPADEDKLKTIQSSDGELVVLKVKKSASARSRNFYRFIARSVRGLKRTYSGNLRFSRKAAAALNNGDSSDSAQLDGEFVIADVKSLLSKPTTEKQLARLENAGDEQATSLSKRSNGDVLDGFAFFVTLVAIIIIAGVIALIVLAALGIIG